jgi:uncharacterized protein
MSLAARAACLLIRGYQWTFGRMLGALGPGICRFEPSCSHYTLEAIRRHGFFKGSLLGAYRILRCNPFCRGGHDPVP